MLSVAVVVVVVIVVLVVVVVVVVLVVVVVVVVVVVFLCSKQLVISRWRNSCFERENWNKQPSIALVRLKSVGSLKK